MRLGSSRVELYPLLEPLIGFGRIDDVAVHEVHEQILRKLKCRESNSFNLLVPRHSTTPLRYLVPDAAGGYRMPSQDIPEWQFCTRSFQPNFTRRNRARR